ncbi:HflK protein [Escherichia coli]|nr:HflK protein [Escherichia coli]
MAWNQPGNNGQDRDPWGSSKPGGNSEGNGNKGGRDQGPPDLDDIFRKLSKSSVVWAAVKAPDLAVAVHRKARARSLASCRYHRSGSDCHYLGGQWFLYH